MPRKSTAPGGSISNQRNWGVAWDNNAADEFNRQPDATAIPPNGSTRPAKQLSRSGQGSDAAGRGKSAHARAADRQASLGEKHKHEQHASVSPLGRQGVVETQGSRGGQWVMPQVEQAHALGNSPSKRSKHASKEQPKTPAAASFSDISTLQGDRSLADSHESLEGSACMPVMHSTKKNGPQAHASGRGRSIGDKKVSSKSGGRGRSRGYIMDQIRAAAQRQLSGDIEPPLVSTGALKATCFMKEDAVFPQHLPVATAG